MNIFSLKEKSRHGTKEFPIQVYNVTGLMAPFHWHEECEFIYINSGSACIRIGVDSFELKQGECAYIKANELHSISTEDEANFSFYAVVFHPALILSGMDVCNTYLSSKYVIKDRFFPKDNESIIIETVKLICSAYENKHFAYELKIKSCLCFIFSHIFECGLFHTENCIENRKAVDKLEKVIKYIDANFRSCLTVEKLANVAGYSVSHFTHFFKEITGKTPIEYINRQRVYYACSALKQTDLSVLEVSLECGFEHVGYFIKTFKKYTDYTPYKYKQKYGVLTGSTPRPWPPS